MAKPSKKKCSQLVDRLLRAVAVVVLLLIAVACSSPAPTPEIRYLPAPTTQIDVLCEEAIAFVRKYLGSPSPLLKHYDPDGSLTGIAQECIRKQCG